MAAQIFHGAPGSYKTSSVIWFEMLNALKAGRIVVTNIEGIKPIDEIEKQLNIKFPISADVWRVSTQKAIGLDLIRKFFHWIPIGALLIIDEVQDVYPAERNFKTEHLDYQPLQNYQGVIKDEWFNTHIDLLESIKPESLDSSDKDDLGELIFNKYGHIIYPQTLKEAFMRHRKYNWDIVVCTPDITQVHPLIRGACEAAFHHQSKDAIGSVIPYFKRRPRIRQHAPKENGLVNKKSDVTSYRKVPTDVHKLYKSTSTGKTTASGVGKNPFQTTSFRFGAFLLVCFIGYYIAYFGGFFDEENQEISQANTDTDKSSSKLLFQSDRKDSSISSDSDSNKDAVSVNPVNFFVEFPFPVQTVHLTAVEKVFFQGAQVGTNMLFEITKGDTKHHLNDRQLKELGINSHLISDCIVKLVNQTYSTIVTCSPNSIKQQLEESSENKQLTIF